jgi:hypothetical protein
MTGRKRRSNRRPQGPSAEEPRVQALLIVARLTAVVMELLRDWFDSGGFGRPPLR